MVEVVNRWETASDCGCMVSSSNLGSWIHSLRTMSNLLPNQNGYYHFDDFWAGRITAYLAPYWHAKSSSITMASWFQYNGCYSILQEVHKSEVCWLFLSLSQCHHSFWLHRNFWNATWCKKPRGSPFPTTMKWYSGCNKPSRDFVRRVSVKTILCTKWFVEFLWWSPATAIEGVGFGYSCPMSTLLCLMVVCGSSLAYESDIKTRVTNATMNEIHIPITKHQTNVIAVLWSQRKQFLWLLAIIQPGVMD